jgi:osmotically-inducible protein OsmY
LDDIYLALRNNSETGNLTNVKVEVVDGVVNLWGTVQTEIDLWLVEEIVADLEGVVDVNNNLEVED